MEKQPGPPFDVQAVDHWYWIDIAKEAWERTRFLVFPDGWHVTFVAFTMLLVGITVTKYWIGLSEAKSAVTASEIAVASGCAVWVFLFLGYMLRIPAQRAEKMKEALARSVPKDEYERAVTDRDRWMHEAQSSVPCLAGHVSSWIAGEGDGFVQAALLVSMKNTGAPSIAEEFFARIRLNDGRDVVGETLLIKPGFPMLCLRGDTPSIILLPGTEEAKVDATQITADDTIYNKTSSVPVVKGTVVRGYLPLKFDGITVKQFTEQGTEIRIRCQDYLGNETTFAHVMNPGQFGKRYFPGDTAQDVIITRQTRLEGRK